MGTDKRNRQKANRAKARQARIQQERISKVRRRGLLYGGGGIVVVFLLFLISGGIFGGSSDSSPTTTLANTDVTTTVPADGASSTVAPVSTKGCPKTDGTQARVTSFTAAPKMCIDTKKSYTAVFNTSEGTIEVALDTTRTPKTTNNFVVLSRYKYYDNTPVFRTDPSIDIIQAGGENNTASPGYTIEDEGGKFTYKEGDLVMARSAGPNSGGGQFFFATGPKVSLLDDQGTYVTFGRITKGLDVAKAIIGLHQADDSGLGGAPSRAVVIKTLTITEK